MGWRMMTGRTPCASSSPARKREVWLLPAPVRTAQTEITGTEAGTMVLSGPSRVKVRARGQRARGLVHDELVGYVAVGEDDLVRRVRAR